MLAFARNIALGPDRGRIDMRGDTGEKFESKFRVGGDEAGEATIVSGGNATQAPAPLAGLTPLVCPSGDRPRSRKKEAVSEKKIKHIAKHKERRRILSKRLMGHEWLVDIPSDLGSQTWFVIPRPEGQRCLVTASRGKTLSRLRNGNVLHRFNSSLPSGSPHSGGKAGEYTILDCIFNRAMRTYFVLDMMCWNGQLLYDCSAEFRFFWAHSKLGEVFGAKEKDMGKRFIFKPLPIFDANPSGIQEAYSTVLPFRRDGLLFIHKQGRYATGSSPLSLVWKDSSCSPYFIDTNRDGSHTVRQSINLRADDNAFLVTEEGYKLARLTPEAVSANSLSPGDFICFDISNIVLTTDPTSPDGVKLCDLKFVRICGPSRIVADTYSKILFQHMARKGISIRIGSLVESAGNSSAGPGIARGGEDKKGGDSMEI